MQVKLDRLEKKRKMLVEIYTPSKPGQVGKAAHDRRAKLPADDSLEAKIHINFVNPKKNLK